jgi:hypothetical protein
LQGIVEYLSANGIKAEANEQVELPEKVEKWFTPGNSQVWREKILQTLKIL